MLSPTTYLSLEVDTSFGFASFATYRVKLCWVLPLELAALMVNGYSPVLLVVRVPFSDAVPLWLSVKVRLFGSAPVSVSDGVGFPLVVTVTLTVDLSVTIAAEELVIDGAREPEATPKTVPVS